MKPEQIFSDDEISAIGKTLRCALEGKPVLSHSVFPTLTGAKIKNALSIVSAWPDVDICEDATRRTVRGAFANLLNYPHRQWERVTNETGLSKNDIKLLYLKIKRAYSLLEKER